MGSLVISILLVLSMEILFFLKFATNYHEVVFIISRFFTGFIRPYGTLAYIVFIHYFKGCEKQYFIQLWYSAIVLGDIYGVLIPEYMM